MTIRNKVWRGTSLGFHLSRTLGRRGGISLIGDRPSSRRHNRPDRELLTITTVVRLQNRPATNPVTLSRTIPMSTIQKQILALLNIQNGSGRTMHQGLRKRLKSTNKERGYDEVAGVTSAFVAPTKPFSGLSSERNTKHQADPTALEVYIGPIASIPFAPWPVVGIQHVHRHQFKFRNIIETFQRYSWEPALNMSTQSKESILF